MYTIFVDGKLLYSPVLSEQGYAVLKPKLTLELGKSGSLTFTLPTANRMYDSIQKLKSIVTVFDDSEEIFRGRVLHDEKDFLNRKEVYCEGELAFLLDSIQRPYEFRGDIPALFSKFVTSHNEQVEPEKQFIVGEITVTDPNNYINRSNVNYSNTWDEISDKLLSTHGGYLRPRLSDGKRYLDLVSQYGKTNSQTIEFGKNMLDISEYITAENVFTVLIPLGADQKDEAGNSLGRLTISSVNGGKDYIEDDAAISLFGRIVKTNEWDDVTIADNLLNKGRAFLDASIEMSVTLTLNAVDLHLINVATERIGLGDYVQVVSIPHNLNRAFLCSKIVLDMVNLDNSEYTLGVTYTTMTEKQASGTKIVQSTLSAAQTAVSTVQNVVINMDGTYVPKVIYDDDMTQKGIFKLLTNNRQMQGMVLDESTGNVYVNASYIKSGTLTIGGLNNADSKLEILDSTGEVCVEAGPDGIKVVKGEINATSGSLESVTIVDGITISRKDAENAQNLSLVSVTEFDNGAGTAYCITFGDATERSTPVAIEGSSITLKASSGITFSADNIIFENAIEAPNAYFEDVHVGTAVHFDMDNAEKRIFLKTLAAGGTYKHDMKLYGGNSESKVALGIYDLLGGLRVLGYDDVAQQIITDVTKIFFGNTSDAQKNIYFYSTDAATNPHKCKIYGGEGSSTTGIGWHDVKNDRAIWVYDDVANDIRSAAKLRSVVPAITLVAGASAVANHCIAFPFLKMCFFRARFTLATAVSAGAGITEIATLDSTYAPDGHATSLHIYVNQAAVCDAEARITTGGAIGIKTGTTISSGTQVYLEGCWTY